MDEAGLPQPCARMKAAAWVEGHWLYLYGGLWEGKSREHTLDDAWRIDLREREKWECLLPARPHDWKGEDSDDEGDDDDEEDDEDDEDEEGDDEEEEESDEEGADGSGDEGAAAGAGEASAMSRLGRGRGRGGVSKEEERIRRLRDKLGLEDASTTPAPGERMGDFFSRTGDAWVATYISRHLAEGERIEGKELRRKAFGLARARYDELWPTLSELYELEEVQRQLEAARAQQAASKKKGRAGAGAGAGAGGKKGGGR